MKLDGLNYLYFFLITCGQSILTSKHFSVEFQCYANPKVKR